MNTCDTIKNAKGPKNTHY